MILSQSGGAAFSTGLEAMHYDSACNPNHSDPND